MIGRGVPPLAAVRSSDTWQLKGNVTPRGSTCEGWEALGPAGRRPPLTLPLVPFPFSLATSPSPPPPSFLPHTLAPPPPPVSTFLCLPLLPSFLSAPVSSPFPPSPFLPSFLNLPFLPSSHPCTSSSSSSSFLCFPLLPLPPCVNIWQDRPVTLRNDHVTAITDLAL